MRPRATLAGVALATLALALVACSADGPDASAVGGEPSPASQEVAEEVAADDGSEEMEDESATDPGVDDAPETFPPTGEVLNVRSLDNTFIDEVVEIEAGTEVLWTNNGRNEHNVVPVDEAEDWGIGTEEFQPGDEYTRLFDTPGEYPYFCSIHGTADVGMTGMIVVTS